MWARGGQKFVPVIPSLIPITFWDWALYTALQLFSLNLNLEKNALQFNFFSLYCHFAAPESQSREWLAQVLPRQWHPAADWPWLSVSLSPSHCLEQLHSVILSLNAHPLRRLYPDMSFFQLPTPYPRARYNASTSAAMSPSVPTFGFWSL